MRSPYHLSGRAETSAVQVVRPLDLESFSHQKRLPVSFSSVRDIFEGTVAPTRTLLSLTLLLLLLCSPAVSQTSARPETGTYIKDMDREGYGVLIVHNNWTMDTVAVLTDKKVKPLVAVYLRSMDTLKITGIEDGEYGLYFTVGNLWDAKAGKFKSVLGYYRYNQPLEFETDDVGDEIEYSIFELDLYEASASNFLPDQFQFPDLRS